jgi:hypothetical protein
MIRHPFRRLSLYQLVYKRLPVDYTDTDVLPIMGAVRAGPTSHLTSVSGIPLHRSQFLP